MEWVLVNPQVHSTFGSLGVLEEDTYHMNDDCLTTLEEIYSKLLNEDRNLRNFRRAVGFGQNIKKDLIPILIHVKDNQKIIELTIKILVNLTVPVECLLSVDEMSKDNVGRHTIFELNNLLISSKNAFMDPRVIKSILDYTNQILENNNKLSMVNIDNVNNSLLLIRNILHIPEMKVCSNQSPLQQSPQNQILWNLFTQSIDRTLLYLITSSYGIYWSVTIVQIIALIYKDQHIGTLQKLLNIWFEASISESSEDNESNTSPPDRGSEDSSPMLTSDPTSDSSDNGGSGKSNDSSRMSTTKMEQTLYQSAEIIKGHLKNVSNSKHHSNTQLTQSQNKSYNHKNQEADKKSSSSSLSDSKNSEMITSNSAIITNRLNGKRGPTTPLSHLTCSGPNTGSKKECTTTNSEYSDCGYVTQLETRESISTSSNEEDELHQKIFHQKHHIQKQRLNIKKRLCMSVQERKEKRRKKLVERGRTNIINMKGMIHHTPTDDDISNVLKEFTVDFLLKGYGTLVQSLHSQLINNPQIQIDTSHFFWLLTYFLKFAAQLELDLEYVNQVLCFETISYLVYEGVNLCEQIQLISKFNSSDLKSCLRRIHLVITAIREFIQTIDIYKKISHLSDEDRVQLVKLQIRVSSTDDLRCLMVLLLRHYQPDVYSKQYLQDLIVTNHLLLIFLDNTINRYHRERAFLLDHIQQFGTVEVMHQYGLLLQDYKTNGEFINDCIFTMMHHVGGDVGCINTLFQPNILKVFLTIWETGFEVCEDWFDLINYVINTFMKKPKTPSKENSTDENETTNFPDSQNMEQNTDKAESWVEEEINNLHWNYMQSLNNPNFVENICFLYQEEGINKTHNSVVRQLFKQGIISEDEYRKLLICIGSKQELQEYFNCSFPIKVPNTKDEVEVLKSELEKQNMGKALQWLQKILLEVCFVKICFNDCNGTINMNQITSILEPVPFHNVLMNQSIPVVPYNNEQSTAIHNQTFLILLHRLGFHLPVDSGKLFVRIPNFWTVDVLFVIACRLGPIDETYLKFSVKQVFANSPTTEMYTNSSEEVETNILNNDLHGNIKINDSIFHIQHIKKISSVVRVTELTSPSMQIKETKISTIEEKSSSWLDVVMKSKPSSVSSQSNELPKSQIIITTNSINRENIMGPPTFTSHSNPIISEHSQITIPTSEDSICETASVTSDLTRMYVSDEEERHDGSII